MFVSKLLHNYIRREQRVSNIYFYITYAKNHKLPKDSYITSWKPTRTIQMSYCYNVTRKYSAFLHSVDEKILNEYCKSSQQKIDNSAKNVLKECKKKDVMIASLGIERIRKCIKYLTDMKLHVKIVEDLLIQIPQILTTSNFEEKVKFLDEYGFSIKQIAAILRNLPEILDTDTGTIANNLESFRKNGFYDTDLMELVSNYPSVMFLKPADIKTRIEELKELFRTKSVIQLIVKSPFVLTQEMEEIQTKFFYVYNEMGVTQGQMMYTDLFSHSIIHIKCRHQFLVRAGLFKKVAKDKGEINKNPLLQDIIETDDKTFAEKNGNMTEMDYCTFRKMFEEELQEEDDDDYI